MDGQELIREMEKGILIWYEFKGRSRIFCDHVSDAIVEMLREHGHFVETREDSGGDYNYVIAMETLEGTVDPIGKLEHYYRLLRPDGTLLLGTDNRIGIRYFSGETDPHTEKLFDGPEGYRRTIPERGRCYTKAELLHMLKDAGLVVDQCYAVFPQLSAAQLLYAEGVVPNERLGTRYIPKYRNVSHVFLDEKYICDGLAENGVLHTMANAFLFVCRVREKMASGENAGGVLPEAVTLSMDRGRENAMVTLCRRDMVEKRRPYTEGRKRLETIYANTLYLKKRGVPVIEGSFRENVYLMPYIDAISANVYLQELAKTDKELFVRRMDEFREIILRSSEIEETGSLGVILEKGFIDMVPLNCFWTGESFLIFDQEFCVNHLPLNVILLRTIIIVYDDDPEREYSVPRSFFFERWGITEEMMPELSRLERTFVRELRSFDALADYHTSCQVTREQINERREIFFETECIPARAFFEEYRRNCFAETDRMKVYVFGAGRYADRFLAFYMDRLRIAGVLDNDGKRQGHEIRGIRIMSPASLESEAEEYKVIICVKNYTSVLMQLKCMGVTNIGIYDAHHAYPTRRLMQKGHVRPTSKKPYDVGYVSGTFDLFHIGHVNLLRRAKERCDYLIVAVTSDRYVREVKGREPFVPLEERLAVVDACKYVDEAVEVPFEYRGTAEAYEAYRFDAQFCGSDYSNDPWWMEQKAWLEERGSALVILPYTEQTNSTKLKGMIEQRLL